MAYIATLILTLLAGIFTLARAHDYHSKTIANTTLSTVYGRHHTARASPLVGNMSEHVGAEKDGMACFATTTTFNTTMVTLLANTTASSTAHTTSDTPAPSTPSLLLNTTSPPTTTPPHDPESAAAATIPPSTPPPTTVFITVTRTPDPSPPVPFIEQSTYLHVSQPGKQPVHASGSATPLPAPPATPMSSNDATGLPHFTLEPDTTAGEMLEGEVAAASAFELESGATAAEDAAASPLATGAGTGTGTGTTETETAQDEKTAWSGVDGAVPWQPKNPPLVRRGVSRAWAGTKGISRAGAPHLAPAKAKKGCLPKKVGSGCEED